MRLELSKIILSIDAMFGSSFLLEISMISSFSRGNSDSRLEIIFQRLVIAFENCFNRVLIKLVSLRVKIDQLIVYFLINGVFHEINVSSSISFWNAPMWLTMFIAFSPMFSMSLTAMRYSKNSLGVLKPSSR
jgi:hypothetical protein